jgi:hypothetical protein
LTFSTMQRPHQFFASDAFVNAIARRPRDDVE